MILRQWPSRSSAKAGSKPVFKTIHNETILAYELDRQIVSLFRQYVLGDDEFAIIVILSITIVLIDIPIINIEITSGAV